MAFQIISTIPAKNVRLCFRAYFLILLFIVSILGTLCCALRARFQLARNGRIPIVKLAGWLEWSSALLFNWSLRSNKHGFLGIFGFSNSLGFFGVIMILTSILSKASDLVVTGYINEIMIEARCPFNTSTNFLVMATEYYGGNFSSPDPGGSFYNLVTQAQINSIQNGGLDAIYDKLNTNINFRATPEDVVASWTCNERGDPSAPPVFDANASYQAISTDLANSNLIFANQNNSYAACWRANGADPRINQLTIITANNTQDTGGSFSIRASFDTTPSFTEAKAMRSFECSLQPQSQAWMQTHIGIDETLTSWCGLLRGNMYEGYSTNKTFTLTPETQFESLLHAMIMSANALMSPLNTIHDNTQGCMDKRAIVPWQVLLLVVIAATFFFAMLFAWLTMLALVHSDADARALSAGDDEGIPVGLVGWMRYAALQSSGSAGTAKWIGGGAGGQQDMHLTEWFLEMESRHGQSNPRIRLTNSIMQQGPEVVGRRR